jgi:capsular exopolysaccharide synthesis family protein
MQQQLEQYGYDPAQEEEEPFPILDYLQLLWFRRRLIIVITILVAAVGYIQVNQMRNIYTATSSILIGIQQGQVNDFNSYMRNYFSRPDSTEEIEVLRSRGLAERVITDLKLLNHAEFNPSLAVPEERFFDFLKYLNPMNWAPQLLRNLVQEAKTGEVVEVQLTEEEKAHRQMVQAVNIFLGKMSATSVNGTDVINVSFRSYEPELASRIANEIPEAYIVGQLEAKFAATQKVTNWLTDQLEELRTKVEDSERAVELYRVEKGLTEAAGTGLLAEQLSTINGQLIIARAERAEAEVRLEQMRRLVEENRRGLETTADVLSSPIIQQLRSQEADVLGRRSELAVEFGPRHPRMLQVNAELDDINRRIDLEMDKVTVGLENEVERARLREQSLAASLAELESQSGFQNQEAVQLRALEREAAANRALFENFLGRFKETSSTEGMETADARVLSSAEVPRGPSAPNRKRIFMTYVLLGFVGACGLVLGLQFLNPGMHSPEQVEHALGVHVMGMIPKLPGRVEPHAYALEKSKSGYMEAVNSLRVSLQLSDPDRKVKTLQVTSSVPEEGKSSLVLSLGIALVRSGSRVLLIDGDLRRSTIEKRLGLDVDVPGLTDLVLSESDRISDCVVHEEKTGIDFMRTGDAKFANATDIFSSNRMKRLIERMKDEYDYILFDTPPVMAVADARVIGGLVDSTLFVVRWDKTPKKVARAALGLLRKGGTDIGGTVLQQVDLKRYGRFGYGDSGYYYHYGRYGKYYSS